SRSGIYKDPDRNNIAVQVNSFDTLKQATEHLYAKEFAENRIGFDIDPDNLVRRLRQG
ncbi:hypothetical protein BS50DRAFT_504958, partial [Corynespora cassiicola Philippines]